MGPSLPFCNSMPSNPEARWPSQKPMVSSELAKRMAPLESPSQSSLEATRTAVGGLGSTVCVGWGKLISLCPLHHELSG